MKCAWPLGGRAAEEMCLEKFPPGHWVILSASPSWLTAWSRFMEWMLPSAICRITIRSSPNIRSTTIFGRHRWKNRPGSKENHWFSIWTHQGFAHGTSRHLEVIAKELLEKEILFQSDLERLIGKRPFAHQQLTKSIRMELRNRWRKRKPRTLVALLSPKRKPS